MTAATASYRLIEKPNRVVAVDANDVEICGARLPFGHEHWTVYATVRLTKNLHHVMALTREAAVAHVEMLAELFTKGAHQ